MKVLFRLNAGSCGLGHLTRNIAIYESLRDININSYFLIKSDNETIVKSLLKDIGLTNDIFCFLPNGLNSDDDARYTVDLYKNGFSFLILDHYDHNFEYHKYLKSSDVKWGQFDYKATDEIISDLVINPNISAQRNDYSKITSPKTILCVGQNYVIIRKSFVNQRIQPIKNNILITMGGGPLSIEIRYLILSVVTNIDFTFEIVSSDLELERLLKKYSNCKVYISPRDISAIYKNCEFAIVSGGVTTFELAVLGIPLFIVPIVENQVQNAKAWDKKNFGICYENSEAFIREINHNGLQVLVLKLKEKYSKKRASIDGLGATRIVNEIIKILE
jgi:spore coat polysaccharide biosynthesis predicted glycosyltransferase SpsG